MASQQTSYLDKKGLTVKDLVTIGIFTVLFFVFELIGVYGIVCGKVSYSIICVGVYIGFYLLTLGASQLNELLQE